jgi:hypothetical protein
VLRFSDANLPLAHKNMYGRDYDLPVPNDAAYDRR